MCYKVQNTRYTTSHRYPQKERICVGQTYDKLKTIPLLEEAVPKNLCQTSPFSALGSWENGFSPLDLIFMYSEKKIVNGKEVLKYPMDKEIENVTLQEAKELITEEQKQFEAEIKAL